MTGEVVILPIFKKLAKFPHTANIVWIAMTLASERIYFKILTFDF